MEAVDRWLWWTVDVVEESDAGKQGSCMTGMVRGG